MLCAAGFCSAAGAKAGGLEATARAVGAGAAFVAGQSRAFTVTLGWAAWGWAPRRAVLGESVVTRRSRLS